MNIRVLFITGMILLISIISANAQWPTFETITAEKLKELIDSKASMVVVDARTAEEYKDGHIVTAINIDPQKYRYIGGYLPKDKSKLVVFYCRGYD